MPDRPHHDLFSEISDVDLMRSFLADLHDDLPERLQRFRYVTDIESVLGTGGTMLFGGYPTCSALAEARSSFITGNFVATILLCQSLIENLLAAFLHGGLLEELPSRIKFADTLERCRKRVLITDDEAADLSRLMELRNPLSHFRHITDDSSLERRSMNAGESADELLRKDAYFAIALVVRILAKPAFRIG
jgi:hypothetical protein